MHDVLITGAGSGIGAGLAALFARDGHHVVVTDVEPGPVQEVAAEIRGRGGTCDTAVMDVTSDESVAAAVRALARPPDVLVNNAGLQVVAPLEEFPMARWDHLVQVMLVGVARLTRALLPGMRARGFGRVVNMGSIHALVASPYKSAYVAAKHGLVGFAKTIALETAHEDITVNTVCPSYVQTPLVERQIADQARARGLRQDEVVAEVMLKPMPKGVFIGVDEIAALIAFLMSHEARNITGQTIAIDGGWTAH